MKKCKMESLQNIKYIFSLLVFSLTTLFVQAQKTVFEFEGIYQGDNVFIQNPLSDSTGNYCTISIHVNDILIQTGFEMSAYEIRLDTLKLLIGDKVNVRISHWSDCSPKILTAMINPKPPFEIRKISIDSTGLLKWSTIKENGKLTYTIEQYLWNKWVRVGEVTGKGQPLLNEYESTVILHSGTNKFRVKQQDANGKNYLSKTVEVDSDLKPIKLKSHYFDDQIDFGTITHYQIYDSYGNMVKKGTDKIVDVKNLEKGAYYVDFDNQQTQMVKR